MVDVDAVLIIRVGSTLRAHVGHSSESIGPAAGILVEVGVDDDASDLDGIVVGSGVDVAGQSQGGLDGSNLVHVLLGLSVGDGVSLDAIGNLVVESLSLADGSLVVRSVDVVPQLGGSVLQTSEEGHGGVDGIAQVIEVGEGIEHGLTVAGSDGLLGSSLQGSSALIDVLTHGSREVELSQLLFEDGLHHFCRRLVVDELEVIPDAPPILVGIHLHADAEGVTVLGNQTVGLLLVHAPLEAEAGSTH